MLDNILRFFREKVIPGPIFRFFQPAYHVLLALIAAVRHGFPSRKLIVIGVTGTNGKSTTVAILHELLRASGHRVGSLSSLRFRVNDEEKINAWKMTMPGRGFTQKFLADCVREKCEYAILEVTSEGIRQFRHAFINFDCAVFTNLTPEHIESHGSFEAYRAAKVRLFQRTAKSGRKRISGKPIPKVIVVNIDDPEHAHFLAHGADSYVGFTLQGREEKSLRPVSISDVREGKDGISFSYNGEAFHSSLHGGFNAANIAAAIAAFREFGGDTSAIGNGLKRIENVPGRFEYIEGSQPFDVIVDYAFTPNALTKAYASARASQSNKSRSMICVLGAAGGGRDAWKRPVLGEIASKFCDHIILADEDPYDENPQSILSDIEKGIRSREKCEKILNRVAAIERAISLAQEGDVVMLTGKGAEPWIVGPHGKKIPWDERKTAQEALARRGFN